MAEETQTPDVATDLTPPDAAAPSAAERVLNQEEIDSLLGFDVNADQMARPIRGQEQIGCGHIFRFANAPNRNLCGQIFADAWLAQPTGCHRC